MSARKILAVIASLWLSACLGTGTDTENGINVSGRLVGSDGAPMANVEIRVHSLHAGPETQPQDPLMPETGTLRTDSDGYVRFTVKRAGTYMAEGLRGDSVLLLDTLAVTKSDTTPLFRTAGVQRLRGKVRLYSGYRIDTGLVFVRGSSITASVNREGEYDFGYVPATARAMTLGTHYEAGPASHVFVKVTDAAGDLVVDAGFNLDTNLLPTGASNLTLFKAPNSTNVCLDEGSRKTAVRGISLRGSLSKTADIRRAASFACSQKVGAIVAVEEATPEGKSKKNLGDYLMPDIGIWPIDYKHANGLGSGVAGQKIVIPVSCLKSGASTNYTTAVAQDSTGTQIHVDDVSLDAGCQF